MGPFLPPHRCGSLKLTALHALVKLSTFSQLLMARSPRTSGKTLSSCSLRPVKGFRVVCRRILG